MQIEPKAREQQSLGIQGILGNIKKKLQRKKPVNNEVIMKQKINVPFQTDFIEQNLARKKDDNQEEEFSSLWDAQDFEDTQTIFEGKRTPFVKKKLISKKEPNLIQAGLLCEHESLLFVACKDGTIRNMPFNHEKPMDPATKITKWEPHRQVVVRQMQVHDGRLFTNSVTNELKVFDVRKWEPVQGESPPCLLTIDDVRCFEIRPKKEGYVMTFCQEGTIVQVPISDKMDSTQGSPKLINHIKADMTLYTKKYGTFLVEATKIHMLKKGELTLVTERAATSKVKGLYLEETNLIVVNEDTGAKDTNILVVDMNPLPTDEPATNEEEKGEPKGEQKSINLEIEEIGAAPFDSMQVSPRDAAKNKSGSQTTLAKPKTKANEPEEEEGPTWPLTETVQFDNVIGECQGVVLGVERDEDGFNNYLITGEKGLVVFNGKEITHRIKTEFKACSAIFYDQDKEYKMLIILGDDGRFRFAKWKKRANLFSQNILTEQDASVVISSNNSLFFAVLFENQSKVFVYRYRDMTLITKFMNLENVFLINFAANSQILIMISSCPEDNEEGQEYDPKEIKDKSYWIKCTTLQKGVKMNDRPFKVSLQDYPYQVDCCVATGEIFLLCRSESQDSTSLYTFKFHESECVRPPIQNVVAMTVSEDEKQLAYADSSGTIFICYTKTMEVVNEIKTLSISKEIPSILTFFENMQVLVAQTPGVIYGINVFTHKTEFRILHSSFSGYFGKLEIIYDEMISFVDSTHRLCIYDISSKYPGNECKLITDPLERIKMNVSKRFAKSPRLCWTTIGNHIMMLLEGGQFPIFEKVPFLHKSFKEEDSLTCPFKAVDGFYVPVMIGGPVLGTGSFGEMYTQALFEAKEQNSLLAKQTLMTPIYPFNLNALHYFAINHDVAAAEYCFSIRVKWIKDIHGKSPLDYALEGDDRSILETLIQGLFEMESEDREAVMRELPLSILLKYSAVYLPPLLREAGFSDPDTSKYCAGVPPPSLFPLTRMRFGESCTPIYDLQVAEQLHPEEMLRSEDRNRAIATTVLNNPVPVNYCDESLELLSAIVENKSDEVVRSKVITLFLNRKWNAFAYRFYLAQFIMFSGLLLALTFVDAFSVPWQSYTMLGIATVLNLYFFLYECVQICMQHLGYFMDFNNLTDMARLILMWLILFQKFGYDIDLPPAILPITFFLMWSKVLNYFSVFKATRYLIKMIFEIVNDIGTFLMILFTAIFAYAQISYVMTMADDNSMTFLQQLQMGYVIGLGELGDFQEFPVVQFLIFMVFSFFIPLVLMNMLIALMADSYTRVQTNAIAADCRALAELELELEELVYFFYTIFRPSLLENKFYYSFCTQVNDGEDDDEGWEGTVGQLKTTIQQSSDELKAKLIENFTNQIKEKTNDVIDRIVKTNTETQTRIDQTQQMVEKESQNLNDKVDQKTAEEAENVRSLINDRHEKQSSQLTSVNQDLKAQGNQLMQDNEKRAQTMAETIHKTAKEEQELVEQNATKQATHHTEMVGFAVTSQNKVNALLEETSNQQKDLLQLVEELKEVQKKEVELSEKQMSTLDRQEKSSAKVDQFEELQKNLTTLLTDFDKQIKNEEQYKQDQEAKIKDLQEKLGALDQNLDKGMKEVMKFTEDGLKSVMEDPFKEKVQEALEQLLGGK